MFSVVIGFHFADRHVTVVSVSALKIASTQVSQCSEYCNRCVASNYIDMLYVLYMIQLNKIKTRYSSEWRTMCASANTDEYYSLGTSTHRDEIDQLLS